MSAKANMNWVTDDLATGGDLSFDPTVAMEQVEDIILSGVTSVIDLRKEANDAELWSCFGGMHYLNLGTDDAVGHHIPATLFDRVVAEARRNTAAGGKTLVHCHMGVNRGPSAAYAVLLDRGMDPIEAFDLIRAKRTEAAVFYAVDALKAHHARQAADGVNVWWASYEADELRKHFNTVWTKKEQARIQHIIRDGHERDEKTITWSTTK